MRVRDLVVIAIAASGLVLSSGCATALSSLESDGERVACNEIASKTGVDPNTVATGYSAAKQIYSSSNHTAAAKTLAAQQGAQRVTSLASSKGVNLSNNQSSLISAGFKELLH